jgi:hypothetical protein
MIFFPTSNYSFKGDESWKHTVYKAEIYTYINFKLADAYFTVHGQKVNLQGGGVIYIFVAVRLLWRIIAVRGGGQLWGVIYSSELWRGQPTVVGGGG